MSIGLEHGPFQTAFWQALVSSLGIVASLFRKTL